MQIQNVRQALTHKLGYGQNSKQPPYEPAVVEKFCLENGGPTVFKELVTTDDVDTNTDKQTTPAQGDKRQKHIV